MNNTPLHRAPSLPALEQDEAPLYSSLTDMVHGRACDDAPDQCDTIEWSIALGMD